MSTTSFNAAEVCDRVLEQVGDQAQATVTVTASRRALTRFANSFIHQNVAEDAVSVTVVVNVDGRLATASTTRTDSQSTEQLVASTLEAARLRPIDPYDPGVAGPADAPAVDHWDEATAHAEPEARAAVVAAFVEAAGGLETAGSCSTSAVTAVLGTTAGLRLTGGATKAEISGVARTPTADGDGSARSRSIADLDGAVAGQRAADTARAASDPIELAPGELEVVLEPACVASILDFLVLLGFNGKAHAEGQSFAVVGEEQFDRRVNLVDDAADPRALGLPFDGEGTPKRRLDLVRDGVTAALAYDRRTARREGTEPTGHAVDPSAGAVAMNVFMAPGDDSPDALIASMGRGLLVRNFWYLRPLDPKSQIVTGLTRNGMFLVEDGRITAGVRNLRFTQSFVAALGPGDVLGVGNDAGLAVGDLSSTVGFAHHVPSVRLRSWRFTGGAKG